MNLFIQQKKTHRHGKKNYGYHRERGSGRDELGGWDQKIKTATYKTDEQQRSCDTYNRKSSENNILYQYLY